MNKPNFKSKTEITQAVDALIRLFSAKQRGDLVYYADIESAAVERFTPSYNTIMTKFRKRLLKERQIACRCENGVGVRLLHINEQVQHCALDRQKRIRNQASKGIAEVYAAPDESLSDSMRLLKTKQVQELRRVRTAAREMVDELDSPEVTEVLPRRRAD